MKLNLMFPMRAVKHYPHWIAGSSLGEVARLVEDAGFDGFSMSEHPYPDKAWLANGGHHAFDPFVALSMVAQATERLRVITYVMVAGYRNPYLAAKAAATLDLLSNGRLTLGMAAGYLETEFAALGADYQHRGALLDEAIAAMRAAWSGVEHQGPAYGVSGHEALPLPAQVGGPPIWIGGNSRAARRRVVEIADGWMPMAQSAATAAITRTPPLEDLDTLRALIAEQNQRRSELGRPPAEISFVPFEKELLRSEGVEAFAKALAPRVEEYAEAGVTWLTIEPTSRSVADFVADLTVLGDLLPRA